MFKFLTSVKTVASNLVRPLFGRTLAGWIPTEGKTVETSRYCHITSPVTGSRWYLSKPAVAGCGVSLRVHEVKRGDLWLHAELVDNYTGAVVWSTRTLPVADGKAIAGVLASACMKAQPRTGRQMPASAWAEQADVARVAARDAAEAATLFQTA
jgi:hypothetical protein